MDPQAALFELLSLLGVEHKNSNQNRNRMDELVAGLYHWITHNGYLPTVEVVGEELFRVPKKGATL